MLEEAFGASGGSDRVDRILALTERLGRLEKALDQIRYKDELMTEVPELFKTLGAAKDAVIAELKTV